MAVRYSSEALWNQVASEVSATSWESVFFFLVLAFQAESKKNRRMKSYTFQLYKDTVHFIVLVFQVCCMEVNALQYWTIENENNNKWQMS